MAQGLTNVTASMRTQVRSLALLSELWYRSQTRIGSGVAVAVVQASSQSSDLTSSLGTSTGAALKSETKKKEKKKKYLFGLCPGSWHRAPKTLGIFKMVRVTKVSFMKLMR